MLMSQKVIIKLKKKRQSGDNFKFIRKQKKKRKKDK